MKRTLGFSIALAAAIMAGSATARAGFIAFDSPSQAHPYWSLTPVSTSIVSTTWGNTQNLDNSWSWTSANFNDPGQALRSPATPATVAQLAVEPTIAVNANTTGQYAFTGKVEADPHVVLLQFITNSSGADWSSFDVRVDAGSNSALSAPGVYVIGGDPFTSDVVADHSPNYAIIHYGGATVPNGASIILGVQFDIALVSGYPGTFTYNIANTPAAVPEPASLGLLGLGGVGLLRRRRT
ncbi:MAG: PEP-CTERM sorting domain-containing protein [Phycisphaerae bacterium]